MSNPSYRIIGSADAEVLTIEQTFDLTQPDCPGIVINLQTMLRRFDVNHVIRRFPMPRLEAEELGLCLPTVTVH